MKSPWTALREERKHRWFTAKRIEHWADVESGDPWIRGMTAHFTEPMWKAVLRRMRWEKNRVA